MDADCNTPDAWPWTDLELDGRRLRDSILCNTDAFPIPGLPEAYPETVSHV